MIMFRGGSATAPCFRHPSAPATTTCAGCLSAICEVCETYDAAERYCPPCAQRRRRRRSLLRAAVAVFGLAFIGTAVGVIGWSGSRKKGFDYGVRAGTVWDLTAKLDREPCDRKAVLELGETLGEAGDLRGVLKLTDGFFARCGDYPRLRWQSYAAHRDLSEHEAAIVDATKLIDNNPADKDFWWWRGSIHDRAGHLDLAIADYKQALTLQPALSSVPFWLATLYERAHRPCDAIEPLALFVARHPAPEPHTTDRWATLRQDAESRMARLAETCAK